jgi:hypothetical protein
MRTAFTTGLTITPAVAALRAGARGLIGAEISVPVSSGFMIFIWQCVRHGDRVRQQTVRRVFNSKYS